MVSTTSLFGFSSSLGNKFCVDKVFNGLRRNFPGLLAAFAITEKDEEALWQKVKEHFASKGHAIETGMRDARCIR